MEIFKLFKKYKKIYKPVFFTLLVFGFLGVGFFFGVQSWDKQLYVQIYPSKFREIAGVKEEPSLYSVSLEEMNEEIHNKLFKNTKVLEVDSLFSFYLGNFLVPNTVDNNYQFVCQVYSSLELTFVSLDVTFNGKEGLMVVRSPCRMEDDDVFIGPFWLPLQSMREDSGKRFFTLEEKETLIHLYDISFHLVSNWLLSSVRFFNSPEDKGLVINYKPDQQNFFQLEFHH